MRRDIYKMFERYEPPFQYKWNRIIASGFDRFAAELEQLAEEYGVTQHTEQNRVFWNDERGSDVAMFAFIINAKDIEGIIAMYKLIHERFIPITFAIIEQKGDGDGAFDIFRVSEQSYLEHCNRAYVPGTSCDE